MKLEMKKKTTNRRRELLEVKKSLWKLHSKEKKYERKSENAQRLERIKNLEEKLAVIAKKIEELREEERELEKEKAKLLGKRWEMMKWITSFLKENHDKWEEERIEKENWKEQNWKSTEKVKDLEGAKY